MLEPLLGSTNAERVLDLCSHARGRLRAKIALFFETDCMAFKNNRKNSKVSGVMVSRKVGRTRLYTFSPRYPFLTELKGLLDKALTFYPETRRNDLLMNRRRPRRKGKLDEANFTDEPD